MTKNWGIWLLLCLAIAQTVMAQEASFTIESFHIKDIKTNEPIVTAPAVIFAQNLNTGYHEQNADYIDQDGLLIYKLTPGNWRVQVRVDNASTEQVDYYAEHFINIQPDEPLLNKSFYVRPVGVVTGTVLDASGKLSGDADLDFKCKIESAFEYPSETDKFGAFRTELPVGRCTISAAYQGDVGSTAVDIRQGSLSIVTITVGKKTSRYVFILVPLLVGALGYLVYHLLKRRVKTEVKEEIKKEIKARHEKREQAKKTEEPALSEEKAELNPRARDILKTLNDREQKIVEYLLANGNIGTQANLRNHTGIPKTSLVRAFQTLEDKKVLSLEKIGKMKKVKLTDWFLGKA